MVRIGWALAVAGAAMVLGCSKPDATGTYVSISPNNVGLLELVVVESGETSGRLELIELETDGGLKKVAGPVSGLSSGDKISLSFKPAALWPGSLQLTGQLAGASLNVTYAGERGGEAFKRSDTAAFQKAVADLRGRSTVLTTLRANAEANAQRAAADERARSELANEIRAAGENIQNILARATQGMPILTKATDATSMVTRKMNAMLERERALEGNERSFDRGQLAFAIGSLGQGARWQFDNAQTNYRSFIKAAEAARVGAEVVQSKCALDASLAAECASVASQLTQLSRATAAMSRVGESFIQRWSEERGTQARIEDIADQLQ